MRELAMLRVKRIHKDDASIVEITLDIRVDVPDGIPDQVVRIDSKNAKTLKFDNSGFEEE